MQFKELYIHNWRQFSEVGVKFHPRLTILTGANGAGKTTILHILNRHWGWNIEYVSTPRDGRKGKWEYWSGFWSADSPPSEGPRNTIGHIEYAGHPPSNVTVPLNVSETFAVQIEPMPNLPGVYVPSHRPLYIHQKVAQIPTNVDARQQIFDVYLGEIRKRWSATHKVQSPSYMLKQSLISLATFGYGSEVVESNADARDTFEGFQRVLSIILPESLGFRRLRVRVPDVILETQTGDFAFDAVSGGISALIDIAWQVYLYSTLAHDFVVAIDEPEAHLHPALQRAILPNLLEAFPQAQFIVATHNPLIVGSTRDSSVYVLRYNELGRVSGYLLDQVNKAGTANEILRDVLGLESTAAAWVEGILSGILNRLRDRPLSEEVLEELRSELSQLGLSKYLPETIDKLPK